MSGLEFVQKFLSCCRDSINNLPIADIDRMASILCEVRTRGGRLFIAGSGGGAGHASHAAADFRKLASLESYCISDNVSGLTALTNDTGWAEAYSEWLKQSTIWKLDSLLVISVGGGDIELNVSPNLINAIDTAKAAGAKVLSIVGRNGGYCKTHSDCCVLIPNTCDAQVTPITEGLQSVILHLLVSHPFLKAATPKWESMK